MNIETVYDLISKNRNEEALELLQGHIEDLIRVNNEEGLEELASDLDPVKLDPDTILLALFYMQPMHLKAYPSMFHRLVQHFQPEDPRRWIFESLRPLAEIPLPVVEEVWDR